MAFLEAAQQDRYYPLYVLAATTGMRQGELLGLHWPEVDLSRRRVAVGADHRGGDVAQQSDRHLAVQIDVLDELHELGVRFVDRQSHEVGVPHAPRVAVLI
jgi:integrase